MSPAHQSPVAPATPAGRRTRPDRGRHRWIALLLVLAALLGTGTVAALSVAETRARRRPGPRPGRRDPRPGRRRGRTPRPRPPGRRAAAPAGPGARPQGPEPAPALPPPTPYPPRATTRSGAW
ncbi:hypothetical protein O1L60_32270 [Streptomyces diastatochromogenes]|nr:hypothetical protein [Streptomyces diastatochromogenes]